MLAQRRVASCAVLRPIRLGRPQLLGSVRVGRRSRVVASAFDFRKWLLDRRADLAEIRESQARIEASQNRVEQILSSHSKILGLLGEDVMRRKMPGQRPAKLRGASDLGSALATYTSKPQNLAHRLCQAALRPAPVLAFLDLLLERLTSEKQPGVDAGEAGKLEQAVAALRQNHAPHLDDALSFDSSSPAARVTTDLRQLLQDFTAVQQVHAQQQPRRETWSAPYVRRVSRFQAAMEAALSAGTAQPVTDELSKPDSIFLPLLAATAASELRTEVDIDGLGEVRDSTSGPCLGLTEIKALNMELDEACRRLEVPMAVLDTAWQWSGSSGEGELTLMGTVLVPRCGADGGGDVHLVLEAVGRRLRQRSRGMSIAVR